MLYRYTHADTWTGAQAQRRRLLSTVRGIKKSIPAGATLAATPSQLPQRRQPRDVVAAPGPRPHAGELIQEREAAQRVETWASARYTRAKFPADRS